MDDRTYIVALFFKYNESPTLTRRAYRNEKGIKCPFNDQKITRIADTFKKTGSIWTKKGSGRPSCLMQQSQTVLQVNEELKKSHSYRMISLRETAVHDDFSASTNSVH